MNSGRLILASSSPRRKELLESAGLEFLVMPGDIDESRLNGESPGEYVRRMARLKGEMVSRDFPRDWILSADTIVVLGETIMGKPADRQEAAHMLGLLSASTHLVITGFCLLNPDLDLMKIDHVETRVTFRELSPKDIARYIDSGEVWDKAGAYAIQGQGSILTDRITGSYTNVIGLPVAEVLSLLRRQGVITTTDGDCA